jgi:hypothetical protein
VIVLGPVLLLHGFLLQGRVSTQHPDLLAFWLPDWSFLGTSLRSGHVPVWNPYAMGGVPFAADPQSGWMYLPAMLAFTALPAARAVGVMVGLQPVIAGLGLYAFLRIEGLSRPASALGGSMVALALAQSRLALFLPFPSAFAWTAVTLAATSKLVHARTPGGRIGWTLGAAVAWGQLLAAHPGHGALIGTAAVLAYLVAATVPAIRSGAWSRRTAVTALALLAVATVGVNLAWLLPRLAYVPHTSYGESYAATAQLVSVGAARPLKLAAVPGTYLGAAGLLLASAGVWLGRRRHLSIAFIAFGVAGYVASLGPVARWLAPRVASVPGLSFYRHYPDRFQLALLLSIPVLAALGLDGWRARAEASRSHRVWLLAPGGALWVVLPLAMGGPLGQLSFVLAGAALLVTVVVAVPRWRWLAPALVGLCVLEMLAAGVVGQVPGSWGLPTSADGLFGADATGWYESLHRPDVDAASYARADAVARALPGPSPSEGRFVGFAPGLVSRRGYLGALESSDWPLTVNQRGMLFAAPDAQGYNPFQLGRYWRFVRAVDVRPIDYNAAVFTRLSPLALDLLAVRDVVAPVGRPPEPGDHAVAHAGRWALYRRTASPPMAQVFAFWRVTDSSDGALARVLAPGFDPQRSAVVEAAPPPPPAGTSRGGVATPVGYRATGTSSATLAVSTRTRALVLVRTPFTPGWTATVDGRPAPVLAADYLDQAVVVPPGRHTLVLRYRDPWIARGLTGSGVAVALLLGAWIVVWRRQPHAPGGPPKA